MPFLNIQLLGADLEFWRYSQHTGLLLTNCPCPGKPALKHSWSHYSIAAAHLCRQSVFTDPVLARLLSASILAMLPGHALSHSGLPDAPVREE